RTVCRTKALQRLEITNERRPVETKIHSLSGPVPLLEANAPSAQRKEREKPFRRALLIVHTEGASEVNPTVVVMRRLSVGPQHARFQPYVVVEEDHEPVLDRLERLVQRVALVPPLHVQVAQPEVRMHCPYFLDDGLGPIARPVLDDDRLTVPLGQPAFG